MADKLLAEWFWIDRWVGSSAFGLPLEARGLYREMLTQAWRRGAQLPNDPNQIQRMAGVTPKEWRRTWPLVERFWRVEGDSLVNDTQLTVYAEAQERADEATIRAQKGAEGRWRRTARAMPKQCSSNAQALPEQSTSNAQAMLKQCPPSPSLSLSPERTNTTPPANLSVSEEIAEKAGRFLDRYVEIYAEERRGAYFRLKPVLHFQTACELVQGWPDLARLELMARTFCKLKQAEEPMAWPGTPAQFLHLAPALDAKLREIGA